jgi:hypothetical protein
VKAIIDQLGKLLEWLVCVNVNDARMLGALIPSIADRKADLPAHVISSSM